MNGAESLVRTLVVNGVDVRFTNPGTSEMHSYQRLRTEFWNVGAGTPGERVRDMLTLDRPDLDWVALARAHGVEGGRAFGRRGPYLVELVL